MRELDIGETANDLPLVQARNYWNPSGLKLTQGHAYHFQVSDVVCWKDATLDATPQEGLLNPPSAFHWPLIAWLRRCRKANWYTLIGNVGKNRDSFFFIGSGTDYTAQATGELYTFANDAPFFYFNNHGNLRLTVRRIR
ncbi:MAG: hypothetical protein M3Z21_05435 [Pseudomonadota bacterium]|nr:hypothetical protein [Pseudomonadota bacterium]